MSVSQVNDCLQSAELLVAEPYLIFSAATQVRTDLFEIDEADEDSLSGWFVWFANSE
jgi:hypothetical protein